MGINNHNGARWVFQLRDGLSHNFEDTQDDLCQCMLNKETTGHFILKCPNFNEQGNELFRNVNPTMLANNMHHLNDSEMVCLFLYVDVKLKSYKKRTIFKESINFIGKTSRFSQNQRVNE